MTVCEGQKRVTTSFMALFSSEKNTTFLVETKLTLDMISYKSQILTDVVAPAPDAQMLLPYFEPTIDPILIGYCCLSYNNARIFCWSEMVLYCCVKGLQIHIYKTGTKIYTKLQQGSQ